MGRGPGSLAAPPSLLYGRAGQPIRFWLDNRQSMRTRSIILFAARYIFIGMATSLFMQASSLISSFASAVRYLIRIHSYLIYMMPVFRRYTQPGYLGPWLGFQALTAIFPIYSLLLSRFRRTRRERSRPGRALLCTPSGTLWLPGRRTGKDIRLATFPRVGAKDAAGMPYRNWRVCVMSNTNAALTSRAWSYVGQPSEGASQNDIDFYRSEPMH